MKSALPVAGLLLFAPLVVANDDLSSAETEDALAPAADPSLSDDNFWNDEETARRIAELRQCDGSIVRADSDERPPLIQREPATPDGVFMLKAVDINVDGCAVMLLTDGEWEQVPTPQNNQVFAVPAQ